MPSRHAPADEKLIDSLPMGVITAFRSSIYLPTYVASNAHLFITNDWIDAEQLRQFLKRVPDPDRDAPPPESPPARVKLEDDASATRFSVSEDTITPVDYPSVITRILKEGNREVFEILSDSDSEDSEENGLRSKRGGHDSGQEISDPRESSPLPPSDIPSETSYLTDFDGYSSSDESDAAPALQKSDTVWLDEGISSRVRVGEFRVTKNLTVDRIEYVSGGLSSIYPISEARTAIVIDVDDPKFAITDGNGKLYSVDALIKNKDNDSWKGNTGAGDSKVMVTFEPGLTIECRRSRLDCKGSYVCERVDERLVNVVRHDLDPASREAVFAAQRETRRAGGTTAERRATEFAQLVRDQKCTATDPNGARCTGIPVLKTKNQTLRGHKFLVVCSGWRRGCEEKHRVWSIPDDVEEAPFIRALFGQPLALDTSKDTPPCSAIVHPHTGLRQQHCPHAHIINGKAVISRIVNRPCEATRTIYVPVDPSIRKALIVHGHGNAHNHPMPALTKVSYELKASYRQCIKAVGCVGATVAKVDNAPSTQLLLDGKTPGEFAPAFQSNRVKRKLVREAKQEAYPAGLDAAGAFKMFFDDLKKGVDDRYVQRVLTMPDGGLMVLTCLSALMKLLDDSGVTSFETDTTFRRVDGEMNEWEVVLFLKALNRAVTIARAYVNGASAQFFERLYGEFQAVKVELTGKPIAFKRFVEGGNLLAMNSDMEAAQVLRAARSFLKTNDPEYSNLSNDTPAEEVAPEFIKLCTTHAKRAVLDFKSLVSEQDYTRLMDFVYIDSAEALAEFSEFVRGLGVKKIQGAVQTSV
ncbi:hypothetical protein FB451DRAFT_1564753 [Mycena latifolia]|nr:hypothetical protein FB451DRAFT_1564753 [Mycena latifolia]